MRRTLLIGASGQLGSALARCFSSDALVTTSCRHAGGGEIRLDLADVHAVDDVLQRVRPQLVLIAGAMCHVDQCELEAARCAQVNVDGPAAVAAYAAASGARVVFFSTDHVFDGAQAEYAEGDAVNPLNAYARSKAAAETRIRVALPDRHLIVRAAWMYGPDRERRNFVLRLVDRLAAGEPVVVPSDQWGSPTHTEDLARATRHLVERGLGGTFHATGPDFVDRGTLARRVCAEFGLEPGAVILRPTCELGQAASRPLRVRLNCRKLHEAGAPPFRGIADGLGALAAQQRA